MKKLSLMIVLFSVVVILAVSPVRAQTGREMTASIPFPFMIGNKIFPAGKYNVTRVNTQSDKAAVAIRSTDGRVAQIVLATSVQAGKAHDSARLVFTRYEGQYFLYQIWTPADQLGLVLRKSRSERTLMARNRAGERAIIALTTRHR